MFLNIELSSKPERDRSSCTFFRNDMESSIDGSDIVYLNFIVGRILGF